MILHSLALGVKTFETRPSLLLDGIKIEANGKRSRLKVSDDWHIFSGKSDTPPQLHYVTHEWLQSYTFINFMTNNDELSSSHSFDVRSIMTISKCVQIYNALRCQIALFQKRWTFVTLPSVLSAVCIAQHWYLAHRLPRSNKDPCPKILVHKSEIKFQHPKSGSPQRN